LLQINSLTMFGDFSRSNQADVSAFCYATQYLMLEASFSGF